MLIISASNVSTTTDKSQSLVVAYRIAAKLQNTTNDIEVLDLRDYVLKPCFMCEKCIKDWQCIWNDNFSQIQDKMAQHDGFIIISPHYAGIPSKLMMLIEKLQEMSYLKYCTGTENTASMAGKYVCIVAHGGMTEDYERIYTENIIKPLSNMLGGIGMKVLNEKCEKPLCFGVKKYYQDKDDNSVCFRKDNDDEKVAEVIQRVEALINSAVINLA